MLREPVGWRRLVNSKFFQLQLLLFVKQVINTHHAGKKVRFNVVEKFGSYLETSRPVRFSEGQKDPDERISLQGNFFFQF